MDEKDELVKEAIHIATKAIENQQEERKSNIISHSKERLYFIMIFLLLIIIIISFTVIALFEIHGSYSYQFSAETKSYSKGVAGIEN